jgi:hypothetical protein
MSVSKRKWTTSKGVVNEAWTVTFTDHQGKRRLRTFERKKDADQFNAEIKTAKHVILTQRRLPHLMDFKRVPPSLHGVVGLHDLTDYCKMSGVYFLCREGALLYVGQSTDVINRFGQHRRHFEFDTALFIPCAHDDLDRVESEFIRKLRPPMNGTFANGRMHTPDAVRGRGGRPRKVKLVPPADPASAQLGA